MLAAPRHLATSCVLSHDFSAVPTSLAVRQPFSDPYSPSFSDDDEDSLFLPLGLEPQTLNPQQLLNPSRRYWAAMCSLTPAQLTVTSQLKPVKEDLLCLLHVHT